MFAGQHWLVIRLRLNVCWSALLLSIQIESAEQAWMTASIVEPLTDIWGDVGLTQKIPWLNS